MPPTCTVPLPEQLGAASGGALGKGALATVRERSRRLCLQRYEKDLRRPDSYLRYYQRLEVPLTPAQLAVFAGARCAVLAGIWRRALRLEALALAGCGSHCDDEVHFLKPLILNPNSNSNLRPKSSTLNP